MRIDVSRAAALTLFADRERGATISKRSRTKDHGKGVGADWRTAGPIVDAIVDLLMDKQGISLSWKVRSLPARGRAYRITHAMAAKRAANGSRTHCRLDHLYFYALVRVPTDD